MDAAAKGIAIKIADAVWSGDIPPNRGCVALAELAARNGWPSELDIFTALAHEQTEHESLGFTLANTAPLIVDACREFLHEMRETVETHRK